VLKFVGELSQAFITSTSPTMFDDAMEFGDRNRKFFVVNGAVVSSESRPIGASGMSAA